MGRRQKLLTALLLSSALLCLSACQKTPEKKAVVSKAGGIAKENIIDPVKKGEKKKIDAPTHWQETMESDDKRVTLTADIDIIPPEVSNTPVWELVQKQLSEKKLKELVKYFSGDKKTYQEPRVTKQELHEESARIKNQEGQYAFVGTLQASEWAQRTEDVIKKAPEAKEEKKYITPVFTNPVLKEKNEIADIGNPPYTDRGNVVLTEKNTFEARVDDGQDIDPYILATQYNKKAGSSSCFSFSKGKTLMEEEVVIQENLLKFFEADPHSSRTPEEDAHEKEKVGIMREKISAESSISLEDARVKAEEVLADLGIKDMKQLREYKLLAAPLQPFSIYQSDDIWNDAKVGYGFAFTKTVDGLNVNDDISMGDSTRDLPEQSYQALFQTEIMYIEMTDEGIVNFQWENMYEKKAVIAENTKLLPFDQVKERLMDHAYYSCTSEDTDQNADSSVMTNPYTVTSAKLQYVQSAAYEQPERAWLVPAWVFTVDRKYILNGKTVPLLPETYAFDAINGGYISRAFPEE